MKNICFIGDTHRRWIDFRETIERANLTDAIIIHLGDGAYGLTEDQRTEQEVLLKNDKWLAERNCILYNVRGNHDNPYWFKSKAKLLNHLLQLERTTPAWRKDDFYYKYYHIDAHKFADFVHGLTNIKFVKDYTIIDVEGLRILCIGGAISIDRKILRVNETYFADEVLKYHPIVTKIKGVDIVATHTAPNFARPQAASGLALEYARKDRTLIHELEEERLLMTKIYNEIKKNNPSLKRWLYGHFHQYWSEEYDGVEFTCLKQLQLFNINPIA